MNSNAARVGFLQLILTLIGLSWAGSAVAADRSHISADSPLAKPQGKVVLEVHGAITNTNADGAALFDRAMLKALPPIHIDTHTSVTDGVQGFDGFLIRDLLKRVGATGSTVIAKALNDYIIEFPIEEFSEYDVVAAYKMNGKPLLPSDKGPLWIVYPRDDDPRLQDIRYDYRWVWQLYRIDIK